MNSPRLSTDRSMTDLAGPWALTDADGAYQLEMAVPGDVHSALVTDGVLADPYEGKNEYDARWVADRTWVLRRSFVSDGRPTWLDIAGVDTVAEITLNGGEVLRCENAFRRYFADLTPHLLDGENLLEVRIKPALEEAAARQAAQPFRVPYHEDNSPLPNGNMLRKPQCDFGWDWNIALAPLGITGHVRLVTGPVLRDLHIRQVHEGGRVEVVVSGDILSPDGTPAPWRIELDGQVASGTGIGAVEARFRIEDPQLWWPNGQGEQNLYDLKISVGETVEVQPIALRHVELLTDADKAGARFALRINGREVFAKGANWIPADALPGRIAEKRTRDLLRSAKDAHMNMIRVWGGGRYEPDSFYRACDALGLMVWQDFMFACNLYPSTPEFLAEVDAEAREQVRRLDHHVTLWCGDNELIGALTWFEESVNDRDRYLVAYDRLNRTVETALKETSPGAVWWPSSPSPGPMSFGDAWHDDGSGDMHFWSVWHEGRDFEHYRDVKPRFCSEFGFQSFPSMPVVRRFAGPEDMNIASPVMESHQKNAGGNARIAETMFRYFRFPQAFEDFVWLSQIQQGLAIRTAVEYWRSLRPHCMGTLYWQLNDTWPVASWSSLDHGGGWKLLHHMASRFYDPVLVAAIPDSHGVRFVAINDHPETVPVSLRVMSAAPDARLTELAGATADVDAGQALPLTTIRLDRCDPDNVLVYDWSVSGGPARREHLSLTPYKHLPLADPGLTLDINQTGVGWDLTLKSTALALFASVEADIPGRLSDNAVTVLPDSPTTLHFKPEDPGAIPVFRTRDLYSATYAQAA